MHRAPTLRQIIRNDHAAFVGVVLVPCIGVGLSIANAAFGFPGRLATPPLAGDHPLFLVLAAASLVGGAIVLLARRRFFDELFANGERVQGTIVSIRFLQSRGDVDVAFEHRGEAHRVRCRIHRTPRAAALCAGQPVKLLVDPARPSRAILLDLFL